MQDLVAKQNGQVPGLLPVVQAELFAWWQWAGRVLPWREKDFAGKADASTVKENGSEPTVTLREEAFSSYMTQELRRDPYRVVVAEMMLQQTQVDRVLPKYEAWMKKWPKIENLAKAELAEVLIFWQGLGYNRRARFLWLLAKEISEKNEGSWPQTELELLKLPGIGKYTARAILSFAFGQHVAVVDTNVKRVIRRIFDGKETAAAPTISELEWFSWADRVLPVKDADPWNQLIMDFGALICSAKTPQCKICPVRQNCTAQAIAEKAGFETYRDFLKKNPPQTTKKKKPTVRFEDTDRYFRGRIIDQLRITSQNVETLWQTLNQEHGLTDRDRFDKIIHSLATEGLLSQNTDTGVLSLG